MSSLEGTSVAAVWEKSAGEMTTFLVVAVEYLSNHSLVRIHVGMD